MNAAQNIGRKKLWQIWQFTTSKLKFCLLIIFILTDLLSIAADLPMFCPPKCFWAAIHLLLPTYEQSYHVKLWDGGCKMTTLFANAAHNTLCGWLWKFLHKYPCNSLTTKSSLPWNSLAQLYASLNFVNHHYLILSILIMWVLLVIDEF